MIVKTTHDIKLLLTDLCMDYVWCIYRGVKGGVSRYPKYPNLRRPISQNPKSCEAHL